MDDEELTMIELNEVEHRWAENGNPALGVLPGLPAYAAYTEFERRHEERMAPLRRELAEPEKVEVDLSKPPKLPWVVTDPQTGEVSVDWDIAREWEITPEQERQMAETAEKYKRDLGPGWLAPRVPPRKEKPGGDFMDFLKGPVGAFLFAGLAILGILALSKKR